MTRYFVKMERPIDVASATMTLRANRGESAARRSAIDPSLFIADIDEHDEAVLREAGAKLYEDIQFAPMSDLSTLGARQGKGLQAPATMGTTPGDLAEVMQQIKADRVWPITEGAGVTIAIIDTGVCDSLGEFSNERKVRLNIPSSFENLHWKDVKGHGSMCAAAACASEADGGAWNGVAPKTSLISARSTLSAADLYTIFEELILASRKGEIRGPLVISNSYGLYTCSNTGHVASHPYASIVMQAIDEGHFVCFAAGNNHHDEACNHDPAASGPNSIWSINSHDRVCSVGTVNKAETNQDGSFKHANSSRGPGEWAVNTTKPDFVAPTYGDIVWGCGYTNMEWWGTSGACPQVAGLAALILSLRPNLSPEQVTEVISSTARPTGAPKTCVGAGVIDCEAAIQKTLALP